MKEGEARVIGGIGVARVGKRLRAGAPQNLTGSAAWQMDVPDWSTGNLQQRLLLPEKTQVVHRPPTDEATAREMIAVLEAAWPPSDEPWDRRYARLRTVLEKAEPLALAKGLRELYALPEPTFGMSRLTGLFEQFVFAELSIVTRSRFLDLRARLRSVSGA